MNMRLVIKAQSMEQATQFAAARKFSVVHVTAANSARGNERFIVQTRGASAVDKAICEAWSAEFTGQSPTPQGTLLGFHTEQERPQQGLVFSGSQDCKKCRHTVPFIDDDSVCENCMFNEVLS